MISPGAASGDMNAEWPLQDAKNKLSEVIDKAVSEGPQCITRRGEATAVVISIRDYERLTRKRGSLVDFFQQSRLRDLPLDRAGDYPRTVDL